MPVDPRLFEILVCPACHGELRELPADRGLACSGCGLVYPIRNGVPDMLVEEAEPADRAGEPPGRP